MQRKWLLFLLFLQASFLFSTTAKWIAPTTPEDWNTDANWTPATHPNGTDDVANLTSDSPPIPANPFINIATASTTVGTLNISSTMSNYTLQQSGAGTLNFQVSSGAATFNINGTSVHSLTVPVNLTSSLIVSQGSTGNVTITGAITGGASQSITKAGSGTLIFSGVSVNTYGAGTFINGGMLSVTADNKLGSPLTTAVTIGTATLQLDGTFGTSRPLFLTGGASIDVTAGNTATLMGLISGAGSLTKTDSGTLVLTVANSYQGGTVIGAGTLSISNDNQLGNTAGTLSIGSATLLTTTGITSSRSGAFTGAAVFNTMGNTSTLSGTFGGTGSLLITGGGILTLTGGSSANTYSNGTTVDTGTQLAGTTNGIQGNITLNAPSSLLTFSQNFNGTYTGVLTSAVATAGSITKLGSGTITFTNQSPNFSGPVSINQGGLIVNGSIANASSVTVMAPATLGGSGSVGPTTNSGTLDPGDGPLIGTLRVNGMLTLNGTSHVNIHIAPLSADKIAVAGIATIDGALNVIPTPGFYGFNVCYTIVTSTGLVLAPGFGPITSTNAAFVPTVTYPGNNVVLCVEILQPFAVFPFSNANTRAVGENLDALFAAGQLSADLRNVIDAFVGQSFEVINNALDQMHPAPYSSFTELQSEVGGQLISLFHRLPYLPCSCANPNRFWIEPFGNSLTVKKHGMQISFQGNSGGLALGYDGEIGSNWILGFGGAWNKGHLTCQSHRDEGSINGLYGALYTDALIDQFYIGGALLAGADFYDTTRHIRFLTTNRRAKAQPMALDLMVQLCTAYLFGAPSAFFYPYANLDLIYLHTHKFHEKGAGGLNLTVASRNDATLRTEMGLALQVQDTNAAETICISPEVSIGWVNLFPLERNSFRATFEGATIPFTTHGWDITWNLFHVDFGLSFAYRCYSLGFEYNVEFSPDAKTLLFNQHGNIRWDWKW